jgi:hypothetical protein
VPTRRRLELRAWRDLPSEGLLNLVAYAVSRDA